MNNTNDFSLDWPYAHGVPEARARFRSVAEDFLVKECLGFLPANEGEHVLLHLCKKAENTEWVAKRIALLAGVKNNDVGYCGKKDRHAITSQWFSVYLPKSAEPDWSELQSNTVEVMQVVRHSHKLRLGQHRANDFEIRLREVTGSSVESIEKRLATISVQGVPNYYGEQRFGRECSNLKMAEAWFERGQVVRNRGKRSYVLSAARSFLYNQVLACRVREHNWYCSVPGEPEQGLATGPLWGRGRCLSTAGLAELEQSALEPWASWCEGLEHVGLSQERRALVLSPEDFSWSWEQNDLIVKFTLPPGFFATALLREVACIQ